MHPVSMVLYTLRGSDNAFGKVMIQNLATRGVFLQRLKKYNTLSKQEGLRILWFKGGQAIGECTGVHMHRVRPYLYIPSQIFRFEFGAVVEESGFKAVVSSLPLAKNNASSNKSLGTRSLDVVAVSQAPEIGYTCYT